MKITIQKPTLFTANRKKFIKEMTHHSIAIFSSNDFIVSNGDAFYNYRQNSDLYWLTGISQENTYLVLLPSNEEGEFHEVLFITQPNKLKEIWDGKRLTKEQAKALSGIDKILWSEELDTHIQRWIHSAETIYLDSNENDRKPTQFSLLNEYSFIEQIQKKFPLHIYKRSAVIMKKLRAIKSNPEIEIVQHAVQITEETFIELLKKIKPGIWEYEIEAEIYYQFLNRKSSGPAYSSIIASGDNARILHYIENNHQCKDGDLILLDFGAEYGGYCADLSRTVPVNGKFSPRQKEVYNACLDLHNYAKTFIRPGNSIKDVTEKVGQKANRIFQKIGLVSEAEIKNGGKENPPYQKFLYHGISHHLGLDVHDIGTRNQSILPGMLFTVEPGIYIEEEKLGVRIENNVWVTKAGNTDLTKHVPIKVEEIESLMKK